jgi:hypothetical protein
LITDGTNVRLCTAKHSAALIEAPRDPSFALPYVTEANARDILLSRRFQCWRASTLQDEAWFCATASLAYSPEGFHDYAFLDFDDRKIGIQFPVQALSGALTHSI